MYFIPDSGSDVKQFFAGGSNADARLRQKMHLWRGGCYETGGQPPGTLLHARRIIEALLLCITLPIVVEYPHGGLRRSRIGAHLFLMLR